MAETFFDFYAQPIRSGIVFKVIFSPRITSSDRTRRRTKHMSENKTSGNDQKPSPGESGLEADETTQGQTHDEDVADREEGHEGEAAD